VEEICVLGRLKSIKSIKKAELGKSGEIRLWI
jgi:hypothetical protein